MTCKPASAVDRAGLRIPAGLGALAGLLVLLTLGDPGVTIDEPLDVRPGRNYVWTFLKEGPGFFERQTVDRVFRDNAEHPPLGRWLLGLSSTIGEPLQVMILGPDPLDTYILSARLAPAAAFALLVSAVAMVAGRVSGRAGGIAAGLALIAMPRVFAHAHFGALDTFIALFWTLSLVAAIRAAATPRQPQAFALAGFLWGLALLTKIHAWLLPPMVLAWCLIQLPTRSALRGWLLWLFTGLSVFLFGWPWLWYHTIDRFWGFLSTGLHRTPIRVLYFGRIFQDLNTPWHYPWFYFAVTIPVGLHILGIWGVWEAWADRRHRKGVLALAGSIPVILLVFSVKAPVYDGERLFLIAFPAWAILIGRGFAAFWDLAGGRPSRRFALGLFLLAQTYGVWALHPFGLSYYNALVGGLRGAERLGLELTYWGDAADERLLRGLGQELQPPEIAALAPTLAPGQGIFVTPTPLLRQGISLRDEEAVKSATWLAVYRREAYWTPALRQAISGGQLVAERRRQGVRLSALYRLGQTARSPNPRGQNPPGLH